jgi:hypothetical protein
MPLTCTCCGQEIVRPGTSGRETFWVDETVLAICNRAHALAELGAALEVGRAHLLLALWEDGTAAASSRWSGPSLDELAARARAEIARAPRATGNRRPTASREVVSSLRTAEAESRRRGADVATVDDLFAALLDAGVSPVRDAGGDASRSPAAPVIRAFDRAREIERFASWRRDPTRDDRRDVGLVQSMVPATASTTLRTSDAGAAGGGHDASAALLDARLAQQERLLERLLAELSRLANAASGRKGPRRFFRTRAASNSLSSTLSRWSRRRSTGSADAASRRAAARAARAERDSERLRLRMSAPALTLDDDTPRSLAGLEADDPIDAKAKRFYLTLDDTIGRAPSIGPRTAGRLVVAGIVTVRDLLLAEPVALSARLGARHLTPARITAWQAQARLVCMVPWLRGTHAQMLVGAGYDTLDKLHGVEVDPLYDAVVQFSATRDGQSLLRGAPPPARERIERWAGFVEHAEPDRGHVRAYAH